MLDRIFKLFIETHSIANNAECTLQINSLAAERQRLQKSISRFIKSITPEYLAKTLVLALDECINNAYEHGNLELTNSEKELYLAEERLESELNRREGQYAQRLIIVKFSLEFNNLRITITDEGRGFDWRNQKVKPSQESLHGRGLAILYAVFDKVTYNEIGNVCILEKKLSKL